ncbi:helix-turn-helix domain-containing protein [Streptosporangium sp. H16]|uniref:helix-turn-helix domain-containing protein n=1 Tax=Streptosporangium sp. H16 TaxID=3444184 RepID=UPI003F797E1F
MPFVVCPVLMCAGRPGDRRARRAARDPGHLARRRQAAVAVHLHHSSLAARIARAEAVLGFSLADSAGRLRAHLAMRLVRLRPSVGETGPGAARPPARRRPGG